MPLIELQVPDATGRSTLVVDLGRFSLATAPTSINTPFQAAQEPQHEGLGSQLMSLSVWPESQRSLLAVASGGPGLSAEEAAVYEVCLLECVCTCMNVVLFLLVCPF